MPELSRTRPVIAIATISPAVGGACIAAAMSLVGVMVGLWVKAETSALTAEKCQVLLAADGNKRYPGLTTN